MHVFDGKKLNFIFFMSLFSGVAQFELFESCEVLSRCDCAWCWEIKCVVVQDSVQLPGPGAPPSRCRDKGYQGEMAIAALTKSTAELWGLLALES